MGNITMFKIDESRIWELVKIEEEVNCDIGAGSDLDKPNVSAVSYVDRSKLIALLKDDLSAILRSEDIEAIAAELQDVIRNHIERAKVCLK